MPAKTLVIVESPAKSTTIQKYLGDDYTIIASRGHCRDLNKGGKFGIGVLFNNNKIRPSYVIMPDKKDLIDEIINLACKHDTILLATDNDREGEACSYHLKEMLASTGKTIKRISFNEISKTALQKALESPRELDMNLVRSQETRRILDRIVGFTVSPLLMSIFDQNLSAGRVQSVAMRMVVERETDIQNFIPKEYWNVFVDLEHLNQKFRVKYDGQLNSKSDVDQMTKTLGSTYTVDYVVRKSQKEYAPPPLTTLIMQQLMSRKHGFDAERTMQAAQQLYESGYCTYIRTDSVRITDEAVQQIRRYIASKNYPLPTKPNQHEVKEASADSHEAIRCTAVSNEPGTVMLTGDEKTLYEEIWNHSVASQMMPAVFDTIEVRIDNNGNKFRTSGKALAKKGYLEILPPNKTFKIDLPDLQKGDVVQFILKTEEQKSTQPPARFSEANLIKELDSKQIGRPSTMATILKAIQTRKYVVKNGNVFKPTELGFTVNKILEKHFEFVKFDYSAKLEKELDMIAAGKHDYDQVLNDFFSKFSAQLRSAVQHNGKESCDSCGGLMFLRNGRNGKFLGCSVCRNCKNIEADIDHSGAPVGA